MKRKLNQADLWLINEITSELQEHFNISLEKAQECIQNSNLLPMLYSDPEFVHHEGSRWVQTIAMHNKLIGQTKNKHMDPEKKRAALLAGGSVKTKHQINSLEICRQVRGNE
ncbi:hypothetical protein BAG01nite_47590 [Brevibacillus agri]|uniref:Uncharacterized protein n=1 Tax=Brevibacillus agri TaxID=51101 RepID=A0A3M8AL92_9BACL|nr:MULTISPECIES: hypothetical protein [Brevibacillus]ELK40128.1 hypothetical protein D478_20716 [Brevibacillus agri BAB-2500]MCG5252945.1 hypothetical protein [Brevibacillus agri]MED1851671.1 hypothetical protein [Brevibacillus borstelensis]MED3501194.1 hypothetical protein [Brevibacillus agri]QAV15760.1 hypothetical protein BA6348_25180 [Brevibacillus agri]